MHPIPGTVTDPRLGKYLRPITNRDPGDEQPEPVNRGPQLTGEQWDAVLHMLGEYEQVLADYLTAEQRSAIAAIRQSRI